MNIPELLIIFSAALYFGLGSLWYAPFFFGKKWAELSGLDMTNPEVLARMQAESKRAYLGSAVSAFVSATLLYTFLLLVDASGAYQGVLIAVSIWVGFIATTSMTNLFFSGRPILLWCIDTGYHLLGFVSMGYLMGVMI